MTLFKLCSFILFYFITRVALGAPCEVFTGFNHTERLCFNQEIKGWVSEKCSVQKNCDALEFFKKARPKLDTFHRQGGVNPMAQKCHQLQLTVLILRDSQGNEQSFCGFKDKSIVESNALARTP